MSAQMAAMLDELMGRNRNVAPNEKVREIKFYDADICKYHVVSAVCPHSLFTNTKADLGPCRFMLHDEKVRLELERCLADSTLDRRDLDKYDRFVHDFLRMATSMINEMEGRITKANERLLLTQTEERVLPLSVARDNKEVDEKLKDMSKKIDFYIAEAETQGCQGLVDEAQAAMEKAEEIRAEKDRIIVSVMPANTYDYLPSHKPMEVCTVCGAFLIIGDVPQRVDDHLNGKIHIGYAKLRETVARLEEETRLRREKQREKRWVPDEEEPVESSKSRDRRTRSRDKEARNGGSRSRSQDKERRSKRSKSRSQDKERRSKRSRSRSRDKERRERRSRSRSRDKERRVERSKSRSRDKERRNGRVSRSRSRDRDKRGRRNSRSSSRGKDKRSERSARSTSRDREKRNRDKRRRSKRSRSRSRDSDSSHRQRKSKSGHHRRSRSHSRERRRH